LSVLAEKADNSVWEIAPGTKIKKIYFSLVILHNSHWSRKFSGLNESKRVTPFSNVGENSINIAVNFLFDFVRRSHLGKFDVGVKIIQHI
jgi:hypothetical protein